MTRDWGCQRVRSTQCEVRSFVVAPRLLLYSSCTRAAMQSKCRERRAMGSMGVADVQPFRYQDSRVAGQGDLW